jgi:hypothetical protein
MPSSKHIAPRRAAQRAAWRFMFAHQRRHDVSQQQLQPKATQNGNATTTTQGIHHAPHGNATQGKSN